MLGVSVAVSSWSGFMTRKGERCVGDVYTVVFLAEEDGDEDEDADDDGDDVGAMDDATEFERETSAAMAMVCAWGQGVVQISFAWLQA